MRSRQRAASTRFRVGRVSIYFHHGGWWLYYRDGGKQIRRQIAKTLAEAEQVAAQVNAHLTAGAPTLLAFTAISVLELRQKFLEYHEHVLNSSVATVRRYRAATQHLENFALGELRTPQLHEIKADRFASYLRSVQIAPNGHAHTTKRRLRHKGVQFILETCRAMYAFAGKQRHLPPYVGNPFAELPLDKLKIEDVKPIFVFDAAVELAFFQAACVWAFPIHFTLAKTGLRVGELVHLLIEDLDLADGWLHVRNKIGLGWRVKTGRERVVPLLPEVVAVLLRVIGARVAGPVFLRQRFNGGIRPPLIGNCRELEKVVEARQLAASNTPSRAAALQCARTVWRDAGALKGDRVRTSFIQIMRALGRQDATCPKSWRHTFSTLLQDANVDPLIRQLTLGHSPTSTNGLGVTASYTHTRPETHKAQIEHALRLWPTSLEFASQWQQGGRS